MRGRSLFRRTPLPDGETGDQGPGRGSAGVGSEGWAGLVWRGMGIVDIAYIPSNNVDFLRALVYCATRSYPAHTKTYFSTVV